MGLDHEHTRYYSARPRRVPPEFCTDDLLEDCSLLAALTLYRIITQADDQGRLAGSPKYVRALCFGLRPKVSERAIARAIDELVRAGFLIRYEACGRTLIQVDRWLDLQGRWGRHSYPSRYPAPPGWAADWVSAKCATDASELHADEEHKASEVHTPVSIAPTVASSSSITPPCPIAPPPPVPSTGPSSGPGSKAWESLGETLRAAAAERGVPRGTGTGTQKAPPRGTGR